jgi:peptidoglycan/xylan/chitin deacetylase (PgdA/CDA1 family)
MKKAHLMERLLHIAYAAFFWTGLTRIFYAFRRRQVIIGYHNVLPDEIWDNRLHLGVSHRLSEFESQLDIICKRFPVGTNFSDRRQCLITFDDGNVNNLIAATALEHRNVRGIFFVPGEAMLTGTPPVIEQILMWFSYVPVGRITLFGAEHNVDDNSRQALYAGFYEWLLRDRVRWDNAIGLLDKAYPFAALPVPSTMREQRFVALSSAQLEEMTRRGHSIGCHSWRHLPLSLLSDEEMREDFAKCRHLAFNCPAYCYPFGGPAEVDDRVMSACMEAGFKYGLLNVPTSPFGESNFAVTRISLPQTTNRYVIEARLSGLEAFLKRMTHQ